MTIPFRTRESLGRPRLLSHPDLIRVILRLQFDGWNHALRQDPSLTADRDEPYMNGRLFQGMQHMRNHLGLSTIYILEVPGVRSNATLAKPDGEPDIVVLFAAFSESEPHALIECKRLDPDENPRQLRGEYVRSGIDRFINGFYGSGHEVDFMVAYVLRGDEPAAMRDVNSHLKNVSRPKDFLQPICDYQNLGFMAKSEHVRKTDGLQFRLLHRFVRFQR